MISFTELLIDLHVGQSATVTESVSSTVTLAELHESLPVAKERLRNATRQQIEVAKKRRPGRDFESEVAHITTTKRGRTFIICIVTRTC